jgi:hypothetical protein
MEKAMGRDETFDIDWIPVGFVCRSHWLWATEVTLTTLTYAFNIFIIIISNQGLRKLIKFYENFDLRETEK